MMDFDLNIVLIKYDRFLNSVAVNYLGYVSPEILYNYFQLPFRFTEDLKPLS